ncbi:iron-containing alcohol dehydrogenase [Nocardioides mesophilus]|uniref:Iron-containing alcohol dehydrogenase n=1 Tax=Nocardioides mesophilus TaxID=433659 RepID=A0A7G9R8G9_9ACTN|nr:iron-containing alcohol dehydrogenase [Nocardioides mesophilus]QNN51894.1 iron-containing alcohol dehydrogenase [Nocardioides mesophilus]
MDARSRVLTRLADLNLSLEPNAHVELGAGAVARLPQALAAVGQRRAFVVTDRGLRATGIVDRVLDLLREAGIETDLFDGVEPNPSTDSIDQAAEQVRQFGEAAVVAVGGGSALDAAKGIALLAANPGVAADYDYRAVPQSPGRPIVAVPTTAGTGAETNGFGVIEDRTARCKVYLGHGSVRPRQVILDPELTLGLPALATAATGMDALVHGIESLASRGANPFSVAYATQAVTLVADSLVAAVEDGSDLEARSRLLVGSHLAGLALSLSGLGLVHGIAHAVTNHCGAPHGLALTSVLDEVMSRSVPAATGPYAVVATAMGVGSSASSAEENARAAVRAVRELADRVQARLPLRELGLQQDAVAAVARGALADAVSSNHPRQFSQAEVEQVLVGAW